MHQQVNMRCKTITTGLMPYCLLVALSKGQPGGMGKVTGLTVLTVEPVYKQQEGQLEKMAKEMGTTIHKSIVVSFLPCLVAFY